MNYVVWLAPFRPWLAVAALLAGLPAAHGQGLRPTGADPEPPLVRLRPAMRGEPLAGAALSALQRQSIEPFLSAPQVFEPEYFNALPRIVGAPGERTLFSKSDVVMARSASGSAFDPGTASPRHWNIYRNPVALKDPASGEVLGMQAEYLGRALLLSGERLEPGQDAGGNTDIVVPARFAIVYSVAEIRAGDRLFQSDESAWRELTPHTAHNEVSATIISIYGSGVANATKNQIVVLNRGRNQGLEPGHLMSIRKTPSLQNDATDTARATLRPALPVSGQALVFLTFDKLAYALVTDMSEPVQLGDRLSSP